MAGRDHKGGLPPEWSGVILDSISEGIFTVDRDFRITWFNRAAREITGVPREEALGSYCFEVLRAEVCETACPLKETLRTGKPITGRRVHILKADGTRIPVEIGTALLLCPPGSPILPEHLPSLVGNRPPGEQAEEHRILFPPRPLTLKEIESAAVKRALKRNKGNKGKTARELGIHRVTL